MGIDFAISSGAIAEAMILTHFESVRIISRHSDIGAKDNDIGTN